MNIANSDKLIHHFQHVVDVKLFTPAQIITIIENFTVEIPDGAVKREDIRAGKFKNTEPISSEANKPLAAVYRLGWNDALDAVADNAPDIFGGKPL